MDAYEVLRERARSKRQTVIRKAQAECRAALRKINDLERKVGSGGDKPAEGNKAKSERIMTLAQSLIPQDLEFTLADMRRWLSAAEPKRRFPVPTVRTAFRRLADMGLIRPTKRGYAAEVSFVACDPSNLPEAPFSALSLPEAAMRVLANGGAMSDVELAIEIQRLGLRPKDPTIRIVKSLAIALRRNTSARFNCGDDGRWRLI